MDMKLGQARLDRAKKLDIVITVEVLRQAALNAYFGGALFNRLDGFGHQRFRGVEISVRRIRPPAETAKSAADNAHIRKIQISVYHIGNLVTDDAAANLV